MKAQQSANLDSRCVDEIEGELHDAIRDKRGPLIQVTIHAGTARPLGPDDNVSAPRFAITLMRKDGKWFGNLSTDVYGDYSEVSTVGPVEAVARLSELLGYVTDEIAELDAREKVAT